MFWGLIVAPGKLYSRTVDSPFVITGIALSPDAPKHAKVSLKLEHDNTSFVCATLIGGVNEFQKIELQFHEGEELSLSIDGEHELHLTGYHILDFLEPPGIDIQESDEELMEDDEEVDMDEDELDGDLMGFVVGDDVVEYNSDEDDDFIKADAEEITEEPGKETKKAKSKKLKVDDSDDEDEPATKKAKISNDKKKKQNNEVNKTPTSDGKKQKKKKAEEKKEEPKIEKPKQDKQKPQKKEKKILKLGKGVVAEVNAEGVGGVIAKKGKRCTMNYVGRLKNGKKFDSGKNFTFRLGVGEVIAGWDIGVAGMKIGEKRKLTIPPHAGYGRHGAQPDIPPNATLIFDVELKKVK